VQMSSLKISSVNKVTAFIEVDVKDDGQGLNGFVPIGLAISIARRWRISYNCLITLRDDPCCNLLFKELMNKLGPGST